MQDKMNINHEHVMPGPISLKIEPPEGDVTEDNPARTTMARASIIIIARPS